MEFTKDILFSDELKENKDISITYLGELYRQNSEAVTIVYGFGENWNYTTEQPMEKTDSGFTASISIKDNFDTFHFCFRNSNYVWDNNNNSNYIATIQPNLLTETPVEENNQKSNNDFILELLDNLLDENINTIEQDSSEKQQILDDILSETNSSITESANTTNNVTEPFWFEKFDMNQLIEEILNPVINCQTSENKQNIELFETDLADDSTVSNTIQEPTYAVSFEEDLSSLKEDLDTKFAALFEDCVEEETEPSLLDVNFEDVKTIETTAENISSNQLIPTPSEEEQFLVSPRKLNKFYLLRKKIKLALYKAVVAIPKLLSGELDNSK